MMSTLTATYCAFCEVVASLYRNFRDKIAPKMDKQAYRELSALTDRELNDMGISRGEIKAIAMGTYKPHNR